MSGQQRRLRTDVHLAPLDVHSAPSMYRWMLDPVVSANLGLRSAPSLERTAAWVEHAQHDPDIVARRIMVGETYVGNVVLDKIDSHLRTARLSIYIGDPAARAGGVGTTAIYYTLGEAFEQLGLFKVWLTVHVRNAAAIATYVKLGFSIEGVLSGEFILGGERIDVFYMSVKHDGFERLRGTIVE